MKQILFYTTLSGKVPFQQWLDGIKQKPLITKIANRIHLLAEGFMPDIDSVGSGVLETRIHTRGGIRIYFYPAKDALIILLCGGNKATQKKDIAKAIEYANDFRGRYE